MIDSVIASVYAFMGLLGYHHPFHPTQVHIPIGLIFGAFILGWAGRLRNQSVFLQAAWYCMVIAMIFMIPTVITGWMDWRHLYSGVMIFPFIIKIVLAILLLALLIAGYVMGRINGHESKGLLPIYTLGLIIVFAIGYFGGGLVYSNRSKATANEEKVGQELYMANCNSCHANGGNVMKPDRPVTHSDKTADYETFLSWVRSPRRPMPAYPATVLTDEEVKEIFNYVSNVLNKS